MHFTDWSFKRIVSEQSLKSNQFLLLQTSWRLCRKSRDLPCDRCVLDLCPLCSPWSPWHIVGIQPRRRWPACLPLSCNCTAVGARGWAGGNGRLTPSAPCPHSSHPWTFARAPPVDWRRHIPWSRPAGRGDTQGKMENVLTKSKPMFILRTTG